MGEKSSSASSSQTTQNYDQRQVNSWTVDDRDLTNNNNYDLSNRSFNQDNSVRVQDSSDRRQSWADYSDHSFRYTDSSDRSQDNSIRVSDSSDRSQSWYSSQSDSSQRNTTTLNYTGTDGGAVNIAKYNADLMRDINQNQTDGIKTIAGFGDDALRRMGEAATSMYATAGSNATRAFDLATERSTDAWTATIEKSTGLIDSLLKGATNTVNAARDISQQAITSYQPAENKAQDTSLKLGMIAAAGVAVLMLTRKK